MSYLLRVALPDVPGSLGRTATAIGVAGGDIEAIEIVEHSADGRAIDDVFLTMEAGVMPDSIVSACNALDGVEVLWISRYTAGGNLFLDLEVVESLTDDPEQALDHLLEALPEAFRVDWALRVRRTPTGGVVVSRTTAAPESIPEGLGWPEDLGRGRLLDLPEPWTSLVAAACPLAGDIVVVARRGGPEILDSEIARLRHLCALAESIAESVAKD